ncbi:hypothetical protein LEP1GSC202_0262 [Leptospira yanagawae serovar Saopaulo str. Sao Paulo = ATCC 700523]|uniref:STAS domain-containing protein n=2 Tax=Leptospira yanagawae TaxID=293069 RepID=A0ABY2M184_9LEPT|nr:hypothetical protein [Leptospira yanagawae]EOQ86916.1 hypothetical protein LEP1GSC202_0262 [Leptospira yanagawae serovar Saopaulo str. Sao Paulo = ATCC 700523]TGL20814.1 hypothetical protein EHQ46_09980 [Leptospira yanagawae]
MKSLLFRLAGKFSAEIGSELYLKLKEETLSPSLFCLDFSEVNEVTEVGSEFLKKMAVRCKETGSKLAGFGLKIEIPHLESQTLSFFNGEAECIHYLESFYIGDSPANELIPNAKEGKTIHCPECQTKLRFKQMGDHLCPNCQTKFFVNQKGWVSAYERLL